MKRMHQVAAGIAASLTLALATAAYAQPVGPGQGPCATGGTQQGYGPGGGYGPGAGMGPGRMGSGGFGPAAGMGPGRMGSGFGPAAGMGPGRMGRGGFGPVAGMGPGFGDRGLASQMMTTEERAAHRDKMLNAATPEERQQIAAANHAEMQKRAAERGVTQPQQFGPRQGMGPRFRTAPQAPAATE